MASKEAFTAKEETRQDSLLFDRLVKIHGTRGCKPASAREQRRYVPLVTTKEPKQSTFHGELPHSARNICSIEHRIADPLESGKEFLAQNLIARVCTPPFRVEHEIQMIRDPGPGPTEYFAKETFDAVSNHCPPNLAGHGDSKPVVSKIVRTTEQDEVLGMDFPAGFVNGSVIRALYDPVPSGELLMSWLNHSQLTSCVLWHACA
jgi:hypothetical protein